MKKKIVFLAIIGMLLSGTSAFAATSVQLNLNGSTVNDSAAYIADNGSAFATVDTFAKYYGAKVDWDAKSNVLKLNDTVVSDTYGNADAKSGTASIRAMTNALGGNHSAIGWDANSSTINVAILPAGTIQLSPVVPQMGEHWANPKDMPMGPIYGVYNGKLVFFEYMPAKALDKTVHDVPGNLVPIPSKIDHFDIDWNPQGHDGYEVPHYDMHLYFITRDEQNKIMPAGGMDGMKH
ncbi:hypothetical protein [Paenibacillus sp. GP183]|uniref:hypothetical protein n=1 Tax=Paenibacillus sp. GP183 TaxID=1882751 RepID=UPI00089C1473|nr:hypothetical protein [Paenibacillus sp. GP183]SEB79978.1 hypothetical protein SAMN05443246_1951 [Paenibacillus sp. GP183]